MSRAIFLGNPELNLDEVEVEHSSALGQRAGEPVASAANSGFMLPPSALGDAGDGLTHSVEFDNSRAIPRYLPRNDAGANQSTALETFTTMASLTLADTARIALVACRDRLHLVTLSAGPLISVYAWNGTAWSLRNSRTPAVDGLGGLTACARGDSIFIAVEDTASGLLSFYVYSTVSYALGLVAEDALAINGHAFSMASNGVFFVLLHEYDLGGGLFDVRIAYGGNLEKLRHRSLSFLDMFEDDWTAEGNIRQPFLAWNPTWGFVAVVRTGTTSVGGMKVARSVEGDDWVEVTTVHGAINQPTVTTATGNGKNVAIAPEGRRLFAIRATAAALDGTSLALAMQYYNGGTAPWSAEIDADGGINVMNGTPLAIANWRGTIYGAWLSDSDTIQTRKWNTLSTTALPAAGHSARAVTYGELNFVDGVDDDSGTALFIYPRGNIQDGDVFEIPTAYDRRGANVLSEALGETWRANDGGEEWLRFDAGVGRVFQLDTIAVFGANLPALTLELSDDPDFGTVSVSQALDPAIVTAAVTGANHNYLEFAAGTFQQFEHSESQRWVKLETGVEGIFPILENTGNRLKVDGDVSGAGGVATIFGDRMWHFFSTVQTGYRYLRLVTPEVELPDGFYEIARVIFGIRNELPRNFSNGFLRTIAAIESPLQLRSGARLVTPLNQERRHGFSLPFQVVKHDIGLASLRGFHSWTLGMKEQFAFWPHPNSPMVDQIGAYLCRIEQPLQLQHLNARYFSGNLVIGSEV